MRLQLFPSLSPVWPGRIDPILSFKQHLADLSSWKQKEDGSTTIAINISLLNNNTQTLTSDSYSAELTQDSVKEVQLLTEMYVKAVAEVFGKGLPGSTQTRE